MKAAEVGVSLLGVQCLASARDGALVAGQPGNLRHASGPWVQREKALIGGVFPVALGGTSLPTFPPLHEWAGAPCRALGSVGAEAMWRGGGPQRCPATGVSIPPGGSPETEDKAVAGGSVGGMQAIEGAVWRREGAGHDIESASVDEELEKKPAAPKPHPVGLQH
ncbi:UNVERIFIED_CONTAM: hypothetical protein K2H54_020073 [Gekko kuhli]